MDKECSQSRNFNVESHDTVIDCTDHFELNDSWRDAVISCALESYCVHIPSVQLFSGPPSTGRTKTVVVMLLYFLGMNKQTLVYAPINVAIMQVASQLVELIEKYP